MKYKINLEDLKQICMFDLNAQEQKETTAAIEELVDDLALFDEFDLTDVQPLNYISVSQTNYLRPDEIEQEANINKEAVLACCLEVKDGFAILNNEKQEK